VSGGLLRVVVCGAGPAADVAELIRAAHRQSWTVEITATVSALDFFDITAIEELTGSPVRSSYESAASSRRVLAPLDAVIIAPATYNTVNKLASGVADSYVLASVAELIGRGVPTVIVPFVNAALAARAPFHRSISALRAEGLRVLFGPDDAWEAHPPGTGAERRAAFPWHRAFQIAEEMANRSEHQ
jgi:phosphopantothenoylcysteine synthetase/decarboxylase